VTIDNIVAEAGKGRYPAWLRFELDWECAFADDGVTIVNEDVPGDDGGLTFAGIDQADNPDFNFNNPTPNDVVYAYTGYWNAVSAGLLPIPIGETVGNFGVNRGDQVAATMLQTALNAPPHSAGLVVDGDIGPFTIGAANATSDPLQVALAIVEIANDQYEELADRTYRYRQFLQGWLNRDASLITFDRDV
jgi:lysozyme family protein